MRIWRVVHEAHADAPWSGEGGRLVDGRWHSAGRAIVYASEHAALAVLEKLVHLSRRDLRSFRLASATIPDEHVASAGDLPAEWGAFPAPSSARRVGDEWLAKRASVALRVPSGLVPGDNVLVNPAHPEFERVNVDPVLRPIAAAGRIAAA